MQRPLLLPACCRSPGTAYPRADCLDHPLPKLDTAAARYRRQRLGNLYSRRPAVLLDERIGNVLNNRIVGHDRTCCLIDRSVKHAIGDGERRRRGISLVVATAYFKWRSLVRFYLSYYEISFDLI